MVALAEQKHQEWWQPLGPKLWTPAPSSGVGCRECTFCAAHAVDRVAAFFVLLAAVTAACDMTAVAAALGAQGLT